MARPIDADEFMKRLILDTSKGCYGEYMDGSDTAYTFKEIDRFVDEMPTLLAANIVEVKHGRWITTDAYPHHLYCSVCYKTYAKNAKWVNELDLPTNYCPFCGARMDKEDKHEAG